MKNGLNILFSFLAGVFIFSCQKETQSEPVKEELGVTPVEIQASSASAKFEIDVTSNVRWTVTAEGGNGLAVSWITLGRASGKGNMQVSVRVAENKYKEERVASIVFKTDGGKTAVVSLVQAGSEDGKDEPENILYIGTANLRMSHLDNGTDNAWDERKDRLKKSLLSCPFDVFGIQEVDDKMQAWLDSELSSKYAFRYFSPYSQDGKGSRAQGIGYRKDKYTLSDWHYFWACSTPDKMTTNDGNFNRGGCCCIVTEKATGFRFFVMNNHGCLDDQSNIDGAPVYVQMEQKYNKDELPSFFVGDMNASASGDVYKIYTAHWKDSYLEAAKRTGASGTYNSYSYQNGKSRIDYVFYHGEGVIPQEYHCDNTLYNGFYASDHFPVWTEFKIEKENENK